MSTIIVNSVTALNSALKTVHAGDTIALAAGTYSNVVIKNVQTSGVTITSLDPAHQAVLAGLNIATSSGLTISNLELTTVGSTDPFPFRVNQSSNITLTGLNVHGSLDNNPGDDSNGLYITGSTNVSVANSQFQQLANAITELNNNNVSILSNNFHDIRSDGVDNGGTSNFVISGNNFTNFYPQSSAQHPDAIQVWTTNTTQSASNITITDNTVNRGVGGPTQGIFVTDTGGTLPYQNLTIANNSITGALANGIDVSGANNASITGNTVVSNPDILSTIRVDNVSNVTLSGNSSNEYLENNDTNLSSYSNLLGGVLQAGVMSSSVTMQLSTLSHELILTGNQQIWGIANNLGDTIIANNAGDRLYGGAGTDTLIGGLGADALIAKGGNDTMTGGGGADTFQFELHGGHDTITDFGANGDHDTINIAALLQAGLTPVVQAVGNNTVISFGAGDPLTITLLGVHVQDLHATAYGFTH